MYFCRTFNDFKTMRILNSSKITNYVSVDFSCLFPNIENLLRISSMKKMGHHTIGRISL